MNTLSSLLNWIGQTIGANPNTLKTGAKTIVGAINEVKTNAVQTSSLTEIGAAGKVPKITSDGTLNVKKLSVSNDVKVASGKTYKVNETVVASVRAKNTITPTKGSNNSVYGNSYYEKAGNVVHVHIGVKGITANTVVAIATLPSGYRPTSQVFGHGTGGTSDNIGYIDISTAGVIQVRSSTGYIGADVTYLV